MDLNTIVLAETDDDIREVAVLAEEIWNEHFVDIIGKAQVDYMVEKFQSYPALKRQIENDGYEYYRMFCDGLAAGYIGIHPEEEALFLSKLYIKKDFRGRHLATGALRFLTDLCQRRGLKKIWLTCNKYNSHTLDVYGHLGFKITSEQVADIGGGYVMDDYILTLELDEGAEK